MPIKIITAPSEDLDALTASFKIYLNIPASDTHADALILSALLGGRQHVENMTGRVMISTIFEEYFDGWPVNSQGQPARIIELSKGPTTAIEAVEYLGEDGTTWNTLAAENYRTDILSPAARIQLAEGKNWPANDLYNGMLNVRVRYTAGYESSTYQPGPLRGAAVFLAGQFWRGRDIEKSFDVARMYYDHYRLKR